MKRHYDVCPDCNKRHLIGHCSAPPPPPLTFSVSTMSPPIQLTQIKGILEGHGFDISKEITVTFDERLCVVFWQKG